MDLRTLRSLLKYILTLLAILALTRHGIAQQNPSPGIAIGGGRTIPKPRPDLGPQPKTIGGTVHDSDGKPLEGAHVLVRDMKTNVTRTLLTGSDGAYSGNGFPPGSNYEITAEFRGQTSDKKTVSSYLNRIDNVLDFTISLSGSSSSTNAPRTATAPAGPQFDTFDLVKLHASLDIPTGVPAPIPAILLLHGFGEDRAVWNDFKKVLLSRGWAVMALDLRGHGESRTKNNLPIAATRDWRSSPHEFPLDVDAALTWLKSQTRINSNKIAVIGADVGASLSLIASGRFREIKTVVAVNPSLQEGQAMAGGAQDFTPHSALIFALTEADGSALRSAVQTPVQIRILSHVGGTVSWFQDKQVTDPILQWLKDTF